MVNFIQRAIIPILRKLVGEHLQKKWTAVITTVLVAALTLTTALGYLPEDKADYIYGLAVGILGWNVAVTTDTRKKDKPVGT